VLVRVLLLGSGVAGWALLLSTTAWAQAPVAETLAPVEVEAPAVDSARYRESVAADRVDSTAAMTDVPGGALLDNGGISGQTQYRGLAGFRNDVRIDGMGITSGGPNWMDPPLHYAPGAMVESLTVTRGIPSVADSVDHIGTVVDATTKRGDYGDGEDYAFGGRLTSTLRSVDNGHAVGGRAQVANEHNRIGVTGVTDQASDVRTPFGRIRASSHDREQYGLDFAHRTARGETTGFVRHQNTGTTGNPVLPLDIDFFDTTLAQLDNESTWGDTTVESRVSLNHVEHRMANFKLRPAPDFSPLNGNKRDPRFIRARSQGYGGEIDVHHPMAGGTLSGGLDGNFEQHDARVGNPANDAFFVDAFEGIRRDTYSAYGQWEGPLSERWNGELGARYTRVVTDADDGGVAPGLPQPAQNLAAGFASADRRRTDDNIDVVAQLSRTLSERWRLHAGVGRKTRSPYYLERYAYIPLEATAGLADGNNHIGDIGLEPEVAYEFNLGADFAGQRLTFSPQVYYRRINDYITGVPVDDTPNTVDSDIERVSAVNGDPTPLRYANVEAEIYGADIAASYIINADWQLDAGAGYTRGKRTDIDADLYRIAPASGRVALTYDRDDWRFRITQRYVAQQRHISDSHNDVRTADPRTAGYALTDVSAAYRVTDRVTVSAGIDNLFNKGYRDFLSGFNRVNDSDIGVGERLPGAGRNAYVTLDARF